MHANLAASDEGRLSEEEVLAQMMYATKLVFKRNADESCIHSFRVLIFAATETTSSALSRILHLLSLHPDVQDKLREELKRAHEENEELTYDQLVSLPYLEAVCRETLRV